jgi:hypothetical protein
VSADDVPRSAMRMVTRLAATSELERRASWEREVDVSGRWSKLVTRETDTNLMLSSFADMMQLLLAGWSRYSPKCGKLCFLATNARADWEGRWVSAVKGSERLLPPFTQLEKHHTLTLQTDLLTLFSARLFFLQLLSYSIIQSNMSLSKLHAEARFDESQFRGDVGRALVRVTELLNVARGQVQSITHASHVYEDKFAVAQYLGRSAIEAILRTLKVLGLKEEHCGGAINNGDPNKRVRLVLRVLSDRTFLGERTREVTSPEEVIVQEVSNTRGGGSSRTTSKRSVVQKVTEYPWKLTSTFEIRTEVDDVAAAKKRTIGTTGEILEAATKKKHKAMDGTTSPSAAEELVTETGHLVHSSTETQEVILTTPRSEPGYLRQPGRFDVDLTALLRLLASFDACKSSFHIDRSSKSCRTPRRNFEVNVLARELQNITNWASRAGACFRAARSTHASAPSFGFGGGGASSRDDSETSLFHPCIPMLVATTPSTTAMHDAGEASEESKETASEAAVVSSPPPPTTEADFAALVSGSGPLTEEHVRVLEQAVWAAGTSMKAAGVLCRHLEEICSAFISGVTAIETRLRVQLLDAVSHELTPADFRRFMRHRSRRMFAKEFRPKLCSFDVRRGDQAPEGSLSLLQRSGDTAETAQRSSKNGKLYCGKQYTMRGACKCRSCDGRCGPNSGCQCPGCETADATGSDERWEEIQTFQRRIENPAPMQFAIRASTNITFKGERTMHSLMNSQFADATESANELMLQVNARQFSCFLLLLGNVTSPSVFEPKHAFLVRNKDEFRVPLVLHPRASASEFQDHLRGLSPEQRELAQLMRDIQLSSLLGILVLQVKPQLETALNLPASALVKETELTQALLELFVKHQIPADRLRVSSGGAGASGVEEVRKDVKAVEEMIRGQGDKTIANKEQARRARDADDDEDEDDDAAEECFESKCASFGGSRGGAVDGCSRGEVATKSKKSLSRGATFAVQSTGSRCVQESAMMSMTTGGGFGFAAPSTNSTFGAAPATAAASASSSSSSNNQEDVVQRPEDSAAEDDEDYEMAEAVAGGAGPAAASAVVSKPFPWLKFPKELEKTTLALGNEVASLRPTRVEVGKTWNLTHSEHLLAGPTTRALGIEEQRSEKRQAFDLIDALTRTGMLDWDQAHLHIVMVVTQSFASTLIDTCVVENINPITQVEGAMTVLAQNLFECHPSALRALPAAAASSAAASAMTTLA